MNFFSIPNGLASQLLALTEKISNKNLLLAVNLLERFASIPWHHRGFAAIKEMIEQDHPGIQAVRGNLKRANPRARAAVLNNLVLGTLLLGYRKRLAFYNRYGVAPPGTVMISPTLRCNLRCYGCCMATHDTEPELSFEEMDRFLSEAAAAGTGFVIIVGGEPFMVPWLLDMVEKHSKLAFHIFTNGTLIDDAAVDHLARIGNAAIAIGVDGLKDETDRRKGAGAFEGALERMRALDAAGVITGFSAMMSRQNFETIYSDAFIDTMIDNGAGFGWITVALPQGSACQEPELIPTPAQKTQIKGRIKDLRARKPILLIDFFNDAYLTEGCSAGRTTLHINSNGDVEPCVLFPFAADNIRSSSLADIMRSDFFTRLRAINERYCKKTRTCLWTIKPRDVLEAVTACRARCTSRGVLEKLHEMADGSKEE